MPVLFLVLVVAILLTGTAWAEPTVTGVRIGEHPDKTRFVLDLDAPVDFSVFTLSAPYRVVIDLPALRWDIPAGPSEGKGLIEDYRFGRFSPETSRIVLDVLGPVGVKKSFILPPQGEAGYRLVVDLEAIGEGEFRRRAKAAPPAAPDPGAPSATPAQPEGVRVVVLDPGHGGVDPGAIGTSGVYEKEITLAAANDLKKLLEQTGRYHVVLTRDRDVFVALRERVATGRGAGGELFISLHADQHPSSKVRGASVYTLSEKASDQEVEALAARENKSDIIAGLDLADQYDDDVAAILIALTQRETMNCAATFAALAIPELGKNGKLLRNTHRSAGFRVLKAPDMPSVLIELGYLSNPKDEEQLLSSSGRRKLMDGLVQAIERYFDKRSCWS
ncbi:MAG: N-acetylmuramoyl-L-alanine amidase [Proteobacteria bacterium]|nr:N-acetylmuramoyl-L-alanine amidase [Pseudomonadota bacterium]